MNKDATTINTSGWPKAWHSAAMAHQDRVASQKPHDRYVVLWVYGQYPKLPPGVLATGEIRPPKPGELYVWRTKYNTTNGDVGVVFVAGDSLLNRTVPAIIVKPVPK